MIPGDQWTDPLIKRGEELERIRGHRPLTPAEADELYSIKDYAQARIAHLKEYPLANTAQEEEAQYLEQQDARSAREREEAAMKVLRTLGKLGGPVLLALLKAELTKGTESLHLPPVLALFVDVVESAAMDAAGKVLADVSG